ncbi:MAG: hypothetical protein J3K34DRAFT_473907 [Monoraphidium minutum]|nr:MAG: hypothetical protein J3K34DRAFT_473907 [Monoraphidium minutum]
MGGYGNFYSNVCMLLGTIKRGVTQRSAAVSLPLSKAGLELARALRSVGVIRGYEVFQKTARVRGGHHKLWPPGREPAGPGDADGYPAMYLRVTLQWERGAPAFSPPGDAGALGAPLTTAGATPETVKILSRPSGQRTVDVRQLLAARRVSPPGLFLLSTPRGLMTDVEAELLNTGGVLLAHLGLPLGQVLRVRGALRQKHMAEAAAGAAAAAAGAPPPRRAPLAEWDMGAHVAARVLPRLHGDVARRQAHGVLDGLERAEARQEGAVAELQRKLRRLALEEAAWRRRGELGGGGGGGAGGGGGGGGGGRLPAPGGGGPRRAGG